MTTVLSGGGVGLLNTSLYVLGSGVSGQAATGRSGERVYVNAANGNLAVQRTDEVLLGRGPDVSLLRTYNSQGILDGDNNDGWRVGVYRKVYNLIGTVNTAGSTVRRIAADGSEAVYAYDTTRGLYVSTDGGGAFDTLSFDAAAQVWTFTDGASQVKELYDNANGGRITQMRDSDGNSVAFTYNAAGLITQVADASGESTFLDYTGTNLTQIRTVMGATTLTRVRYSYDASNRLSRAIVDLSPADNSVADGKTYVTTYAYDGTSKRVATLFQSDGTRLDFSYVQIGTDWRVATITDALGQVTRFAYDTVARTTTVTDGLGLVTTLAYDPAGQLTRLTAPVPVVGGVAQVVNYAYDASGNVTSVTDARSNAVGYQYDANGNRVLERDAAGNTVTRTYGASSKILTETAYLVPDPDGAGAAAPSGPLTTRYVYNAQNHLRFSVSAEGRVTEYRYDSVGQQVAVIQYTGNSYSLAGLTPTDALTEAQLNTWVGTANKSKMLRADTSYDFRGQAASTTTYASVNAAGNGVADGTQSVTQYVYDQTGNLLRTIDARGSATAYVYDGLGRMLSEIDALGRTTVTQYDDAGRKTAVTLANGLIATSTYDAAGNLVSVLQSAAGASLGETKYFYDADSRLRRTQDPTGVQTHVLYDAAGRKIGSIDGTGSLTEYRYDLNNNLTKTIQYASTISAASLASLTDALGKPTNVALATIRPAPSAADRVSFAAYDAANRLVKSVDEAGFVTQTFYDGAGRVTDVLAFATAISTAALTDTPSAASIAPAASAADRLSRNFYDADDKLRGSLDGEGFLLEYKYDSGGELVETVGYASATSGALRQNGTLAQLLPAANAADIHSFTLYNAKGQVSATVDGEGFLTENVYDTAGNKTRVIRYATRVNFTTGATLASLRPAANPQDQAVSTSYTALNQVASRTDVDGTVTQYTYDEIGNLTKTVKAFNTADVRTLLVQYDKQGRVTAELSANGAAQLTGNQTQAQIDAIWAANAIKHTYDAAGRRTSSTDPNGGRTLFFYNADGELTHRVNALGEVKESVYNALGQLTQVIQYGTRLSAATPATLAGGLANSTLATALASLANPALDSRTSYAYATTGRLARTTDALGNAVTQAFNAFGDVVSRSEAIGAGATLDHTYAYDRRGLLTQTVWDPAGINTSSSTVYDAFGRAIRTTDARGNVRSQSYDKLGHVVATTDPLSQTKSVTYDAFDRVLTQTDALGKITRYSYDSANRKVTVTTPEGIVAVTAKDRHGQTISVTDGRGNTTAYQYDKDGNLTRTDAPAAGSTVKVYDKADLLVETTDGNGTKTAYAYDFANRVLRRTEDPGAGHLNLVTSYEYDAKGQAVRVTDAKGVVTQTTFDLEGEATLVVVDPGPDHLNLTTAYTYDARGNKLSVTEGSGSDNRKLTQYAYDKLGRLVQERVDPSGVDATTTYVYDRNDNVASKTDADGNLTRYAYDANDRLVYTVDPLGAVTKNDYDANGSIVRVIGFANPIDLTGVSNTPTLADVTTRITLSAADRNRGYVLDGDGREVFCIDAMGGVTQKFYDGNGNVVRTVEYANPVLWGTAALTIPAITAALVPDPASDRVTRYAYDAADRAVYVIDALNIVTETQYDNLGRVTRTVQYVRPVLVGATPSVAEVAGALAPQLTPASVTNQTDTLFNNPVQPYAYSPSAQNDVVTTVTQTVGVTSATIVSSTPPAQPYPYIASAKQDVASPATQSVTGTLTRATVGNVIRTTLSWAASVQPAGTTASFGYRVAGSGAAFSAVAIGVSGSNQQIAIDGLATGSYEYQIKYTDSFGRVPKSASGTFAVNNSTADILYQAPDGNLLVQLQDGTTGIGGGWINFQMAPAFGLVPIGVADVDGNGVGDIVYRSPGNGSISIEYVEGVTHTGGGTVDNVFDLSWSVVGLGDFNGDGKADVAYRHGPTGWVAIQFLNGTAAAGGGIVANQSTFDSSWIAVGVGDFNGDGMADLVYRQVGTGSTVVQLLSGLTPIGGGAIEANVFDSVWDFVGTGDFNGDGKDDLLYYSPTYALADVALLNGTASLGGGTVGFEPGPGWQVLSQVADFNGDGRDDLLWRYADGRAFIAFQNGLTTIGGDWLSNQLPGFAIVGAGPLRTRTGLTRGSLNTAINFSFTQVTSTATAGSSIGGYIPLAQVSSIDRISATVTDVATGIVVSSNVLTYPEFEANYNGQVNLKVGSALANGRYNVAITVFNKNGTVENKPVFLYEVGPQQLRLQESIVWPASVQPAGTTASFAYRLAGSSNPWLTPPVGVSGTNQFVALDLIPAGVYEYQIQYKDSFNRVLKSAAGSFTVTNADSSTVTNTAFNSPQVTSTTSAGSSITGYITPAEVPAIEYVEATVRDLAGAIVSTALTYPEFEPNYNGRLNLKVGAPLPDGGKFNITVAVRKKDGTLTTRPAFYYEVGPQPVQRRTTTVSWQIPGGVTGTSVQFSYAPAGSSSFTSAPVTLSGTNHSVSFTNLANGNYTYFVRYLNGTQLIRQASGTFASSASGTQSVGLQFITDAALDPQVGKEMKSYVYDAGGREVFCIDALGGVKQKFYDALGNVVREIQYARQIPVGTALTQAAVAAQLSPDPANDRVTRTVYDAANRPIYVIDPLGYVNETQYDSLGRIVKTIQHPLAVLVGAAPSAAEVAAALVPPTAQVTVTNRTDPLLVTSLGADVLYRAPDGTVSVQLLDGLEGRGGGPLSFQLPADFPILGTGDFDGDGREEILYRSPVNGALSIQFIDGITHLGGGYVDNVIDLSWNVIGIGDFNGDGKDDVVYERPTDRAVVIQFLNGMTGAGGGLVANQAVFDTTWDVAAVGDFNGDGMADLAYRQDGTGSIVLQYMSGITPAGGAAIEANVFDPVWNVVGSGDFNGDGKDDLLFYSPGYALAEVALLDGFHSLGGGPIAFQPGPGWGPLEVADFNADHRADILWRAPNGQVLVSYLDGLNGAGGGYLTNQMPADYAVVGAGLLKSRPYAWGATRRTTTLSWQVPSGMTGRAVEFSYAPAGSSAFTNVGITPNGASQGVSFTDLANGTYTYLVRYYDGAQILREATGTFVADASSTQSAQLLFGSASSRSAQIDVFQYDAAGRMTASVDAEGFVERYAYDALGNRISFTNKKGDIWNYAYDRNGRLVSELSPSVEVNFVVDDTPEGITVLPGQARLETRMTYDAFGDVLSRTEAAERSEARTTQYQYDRLGRQVRTIFPTVNVYNGAADDLTTNAINGAVTRREMQVTPQTTTVYDALGNAVVNADAAGSFSYKVYDVLGRLKYEIDAERFVTGYGYDGAGNPTTLTRYATALNFEAIGGYAAHAPGAAFSLAEASARLAASAEDRTITTSYDLMNRATLVTQPVAYTYDSTVPGGSFEYFRIGATTRNTYDASGQLIKQSVLKNPGGDVTVGTGDDTWIDTYFYYDRRGNRVAQVDALGYLTVWQYDEAGNVTRETQYARSLTPGTWSTAGYSIPGVTTPQSQPGSPIGYDRVVSYQYDRKNQRIAQTQVNAEFGTVSGATNLATTTADLSTRYVYDAVGNLYAVLDPLDGTNLAFYDAMGRLTSTVAPIMNDVNGVGIYPLTTLHYDAFGNVVRQTRHARGAAAPTYGLLADDPNDQTTLNAYDRLGRLIHTFDPERAHRYNSYDVLGHVVKSWMPIINVDSHVNYAIQNFNYDRLGRQVATVESPPLTDQPGTPMLSGFTVHEARYNAFGEITAKGVGGLQEYYQYDNAGRLWRTNDADGVNRVYFYDLQGKSTSEIHSQTIDLLNSYSIPEQLQTANVGFERTYTRYDALGRMTQQQLPWFAGGTVVPIVSQTLDRWGNTLTVTDARGYTTDYRYNYLNQIVEEKKPLTDVWDTLGGMGRARPTTRNFYDRAGRALGTIDANGNASSTRYDWGGLLSAEFHADGGLVFHYYDGLGRRVRTTDALGRNTDFSYDRDDRLVRVQRPIGAETYRYDEAGNRIQQTNAAGETTTYYYDTRGKLIVSLLPLGQGHRYFYDELGNKTAEINANGDAMSWSYDYFGHLLSHTDLGGMLTNYAYDKAGRLTHQSSSNGQFKTYSYYENGALSQVNDTGVSSVASYQYDASGNRVRETFIKSGIYSYQDATIGYDELGRINSVTDHLLPTLVYRYDAMGNRRNVAGAYVDANGAVQPINDWYLYDTMNRTVLSQGVLNAGVGIQIDPGKGVSLLYDRAGNRRVATNWAGTEVYDYDANDRLTSAVRNGSHTGLWNYDIAGRVTSEFHVIDGQQAANGGPRVERRVNTYNANGWITQQVISDFDGRFLQQTDYTGYDGIGNVASYQVTALTSNGQQYTNFYNVGYAKFDTYKQSVVNGASTLLQPGSTTTTYDLNGDIVSVLDQFGGTSPKTFVTGADGQILQVMQNGSTQYRYYAGGRQIGTIGGAVAADFSRNTPNGNGFAGRAIEARVVGFQPGTLQRGSSGSPFVSKIEALIAQRAGVNVFAPQAAGADFGSTYEAIDDQYPSASPGSYVVSQNDTLRSIAFAFLGDAQLWYVIAEANGISSDADLRVGQHLVIPNKVLNVHNDYQTFRPYNEADIIGDTTPTLPSPPPPPAKKNNKCGGFGKILVAIVAVVATVVTAGIAAIALAPAAATLGLGLIGAGTAALTGSAALGWAGVAAAVIGGAAGSIASQGLAVAIGVQDKFSWGAVAAGALGAGIASGIGLVTGGLGIGGQLFAPGSFGAQVVNGAAQNAITQGVNLLTGVQKKFDWRGIAAAAVSAPISGAIAGGLNYQTGSFAGSVLGRAASGILTSVTQAVFRGGKADFASIAADAFGNAFAWGIVDQAQYGSQQSQQLLAARAKVEESEEPIPMPRPRPERADFVPMPRPRPQIDDAPAETGTFDVTSPWLGGEPQGGNGEFSGSLDGVKVKMIEVKPVLAPSSEDAELAREYDPASLNPTNLAQQRAELLLPEQATPNNDPIGSVVRFDPTPTLMKQKWFTGFWLNPGAMDEEMAERGILQGVDVPLKVKAQLFNYSPLEAKLQGGTYHIYGGLSPTKASLSNDPWAADATWFFREGQLHNNAPENWLLAPALRWLGLVGGPEAKTGETKLLWGLNPIKQIVDEENFAVTNVTTPLHTLHDGVVGRFRAEVGDDVHMGTLGAGINLSSPSNFYVPSDVIAWANVIAAQPPTKGNDGFYVFRGNDIDTFARAKYEWYRAWKGGF